MKRILTVIAATLLCAASSRAQYVVYDPALHTQTIIDEAENIAKYFYDKVSVGLKNEVPVRISAIQVWETDTSSAIYRP